MYSARKNHQDPIHNDTFIKQKQVYMYMILSTAFFSPRVIYALSDMKSFRFVLDSPKYVMFN